jgi:tripartite-type tricarboxylate transporter receptor subunit TctC
MLMDTNHNGARSASRRALKVAALPLLASVAMSACSSPGSSSSGGSSLSKLSIVNTSSAGGGADTAIRRLQPSLQSAFGHPVTVSDEGGGQGVPAIAALVKRGDDCSHMIMTGVPQLNYLPSITDVSFKLSDIYPVATITKQPDVISVSSSSKYKTVQQLVAAAKAAPGKIKVSVSQVASPQYIALYQLQEQAGVKFNVVQFEGGGPAASALLGGQVDAMIGPMGDADKLGDKGRTIAVFGDATDSVPSVNSSLSINVPDASAYYALFVTAACHKEHSSQYDQLVSAVKKATTSSDYTKALSSADATKYSSVVTGGSFADTLQSIQDDFDALYSKNPKIFTSQG